jgi:hypothetical protein
MKNGFCLFNEAKSEDMVHRKIVAVKILYRMVSNKKLFHRNIILKTRLKVVGT